MVDFVPSDCVSCKFKGPLDLAKYYIHKRQPLNNCIVVLQGQGCGSHITCGIFGSAEHCQGSPFSVQTWSPGLSTSASASVNKMK